jgi:BirA family biotin operon repressor/biotin-[acetyl-CoA-carboxylase] ligase
LRRVLVHNGPFARLDVVDSTGSTNEDLLAAAARPESPAAHLSVLIAEHQTAGRGRLGRIWQAAPRTAILASVLVRPPAQPPFPVTLLPLVAGLATARALDRVLPARSRLVWPNDVVLPAPARDTDQPGWGRWRKVAGILAQATPPVPGGVARPHRAGIVLGVGINVTHLPDDPPIPWATSLCAAGAKTCDRTELTAGLLASIAQLYGAWESGEPTLRPAVEARCVSVGQDLAVALPGGSRLAGRGLRLDDDGALVLAQPGQRESRVEAGQVRSSRCEASG